MGGLFLSIYIYYSQEIILALRLEEANQAIARATHPMRNRDHRYTPIKEPSLFLDNYSVS
jgi:hypothetical protein